MLRQQRRKCCMRKNAAPNRKKGFTLVEVIVVLVILAILAAIMVPALTGWIDRARERAAIAEARTCLNALQTIATERYAAGQVYQLSADRMETEGLAELRGGASLLNAQINAAGKVQYMLYLASNGIYVTYLNGVYSVSTQSLSESGTIDTVIATIKNNMASHVAQVDSGAASDTASYAYQSINAMKSLGIDLEAMGAKSWRFVREGSGGLFYWTTKDVSKSAVGDKLYVMRYNTNRKTYNVWEALVIEQSRTTGGAPYLAIGIDQDHINDGTAKQVSPPEGFQTYADMVDFINTLPSL